MFELTVRYVPATEAQGEQPATAEHLERLGSQRRWRRLEKLDLAGRQRLLAEKLRVEDSLLSANYWQDWGIGVSYDAVPCRLEDYQAQIRTYLGEVRNHQRKSESLLSELERTRRRLSYAQQVYVAQGGSQADFVRKELLKSRFEMTSAPLFEQIAVELPEKIHKADFKARRAFEKLRGCLGRLSLIDAEFSTDFYSGAASALFEAQHLLQKITAVVKEVEHVDFGRADETTSVMPGEESTLDTIGEESTLDTTGEESMPTTTEADATE